MGHCWTLCLKVTVKTAEGTHLSFVQGAKSSFRIQQSVRDSDEKMS